MKIIKNIVLTIPMLFLIIFLSLKEAFIGGTEVIATTFCCGVCCALGLVVLQDKGKTSKVQKANKVSIIGIVLTTVISVVPNLMLTEDISVVVLYLILAISMIVYWLTDKKINMSGKFTKTYITFLIMGIISIISYVALIIIPSLFITIFAPIFNDVFGIPYGINDLGKVFIEVFKVRLWAKETIIYVLLAIIFFSTYFIKRKKNNIQQTQKIAGENK